MTIKRVSYSDTLSPKIPCLLGDTGLLGNTGLLGDTWCDVVL